MKLTATLIAALLCATPAWAQDGHAAINNLNGPGPGPGLHETVQQNVRMAADALRAGDFKKARRYAEMTTRGDPGILDAWLMLGAAQRGLSDWKGARVSYTTALRLVPVSADAHAGLGVALARSGDTRAARELAWLTDKAQACTTNCDAITKLRADVETALAASVKPAA